MSEGDKKPVQFSASWRIGATPARPAAPASSPRELLNAAHQFWRTGRKESALEQARRAAALDPGNAEAFGLSGAIAFDIGDFATAERMLARAGELIAPGAPEWLHVKSLRALALSQARRWAEAWREASEVRDAGVPMPANIQSRLGRVFTAINRGDIGAALIGGAVAADPERPDYRLEYADALRNAGDFAGAEREYEYSIARNPFAGEAHNGLAQLRKWTADTAHVARLTALVEDPRVPDLDKSFMGYALFKECEDLGDTRAAWGWLTKANALAFGASPPWRAADEAAEFSQLKTGFTASEFGRPAPVRREGRRPIFVMGLPRSGTTLVERILGAHSQVAPIGETPIMSRLFRPEWDRVRMSPDLPHAPDRIDWDRMAKAYLEETAFLAGGAPFSVDKMPDNALLAGPIRRAFPDAILILVNRAPMDLLFGSYRIPLTFLWSRRLEDLFDHYQNFHGLMAHWRASLGDGLIEVDYQDLVSDPASQIPALLERCGLSFEAACLEPHKTGGVVESSSSIQVRSPITRERIGGWRRYEAELAGLRARLEAVGALPGD